MAVRETWAWSASTAPAISNAASIPVTLRFERFEEPVAVVGLDASDLQAAVVNGTVTGFSSPDGNLTFTFNLVPDANVSSVDLNLPKGAGSFGGDPTLAASMQVKMVPPIQAKDDLVNWWWLDDARGTAVLDSVYDQPGELKGMTSWSPDAKFGTSLVFQQPGDHADLGPPSTNWNNDSFSLSFWFKRDEAFLVRSRGFQRHGRPQRQQWIDLGTRHQGLGHRAVLDHTSVDRSVPFSVPESPTACGTI